MTKKSDIEIRREERRVQLAAVSNLPVGDPYRRKIEEEVKWDIERHGE